MDLAEKTTCEQAFTSPHTLSNENGASLLILFTIYSVLKHMDPLMPVPNKLRPMNSALGSLLHLLNHATVSPKLVFALRVALSLTCTSRNILNLWHEAKRAMTKYLVDEAGLKTVLWPQATSGGIVCGIDAITISCTHTICSEEAISIFWF